jgi:hypothetical protein
MKKLIFRIGSLGFAMALAGLATLPARGLPACPPRLCSNVVAACNGLGCGASLSLLDQCMDSAGNIHNHYHAICPACGISTDCYI